MIHFYLSRENIRIFKDLNVLSGIYIIDHPSVIAQDMFWVNSTRFLAMAYNLKKVAVSEQTRKAVSTILSVV